MAGSSKSETRMLPTFQMLKFAALLAAKGKKGATVIELQKKLKVANRDRPHQLVEPFRKAGMVEVIDTVPVKRGRPRAVFALTEKGKRFVRRYRCRSLAAAPPMVLLSEFR